MPIDLDALDNNRGFHTALGFLEGIFRDNPISGAIRGFERAEQNREDYRAGLAREAFNDQLFDTYTDDALTPPPPYPGTEPGDPLQMPRLVGSALPAPSGNPAPAPPSPLERRERMILSGMYLGQIPPVEGMEMLRALDEAERQQQREEAFMRGFDPDALGLTSEEAAAFSLLPMEEKIKALGSRAKRPTPATSITINNADRKHQAEAETEAGALADAAEENLGLYSVAQDASSGAASGVIGGSDIVQTAAKLGRELGFDIPPRIWEVQIGNPVDTAVFDKTMASIALRQTQILADGQGQVSNYERDLFAKPLPTLQDSQDVRNAALSHTMNVMRRVADRNAYRAKLISEGMGRTAAAAEARTRYPYITGRGSDIQSEPLNQPRGDLVSRAEALGYTMSKIDAFAGSRGIDPARMLDLLEERHAGQ